MSISESTKSIKDKVRKTYSSPKPIDMRNALMNTLSGIPKQDSVSVCVSGGVDSHACLFAAYELGLNPTVVSFTLEGYESFDFKSARHVSELLNLTFQPVYLKTDVNHLMDYVRFAIKKLGFVKKADIECGWPMVMAIKECKTKHIVTGTGSDSFFLLNKTSMMHLRDMVPQYRYTYFRKNGAGQRFILQKYTFSKNKVLHMPFFDARVYAELAIEEDWDTLNSPQKACIRTAWPELLKRCKIKQHTNLQLGDSGISKHFNVLLDTHWNIRKSKSVVGVYNNIINGDV